MTVTYLTYLLAAFVSTFGFCVMYNVPTRTLLASSISGAVGWLVFYIIAYQFELVLFIGAGAASFLIAFLSQWFARRYRMPVIVFAVPAIIPLVPGSSAYSMMRAFIEGDSEAALLFGTETFLISGAIALGLSLNSGLFQVFSSRAFGRREKRYLP
ncbi:threonine/serine exporter family protein [Alkalibacterium kapii]|uniref:Membrane protein n=1 Tax=Alkalibacterium kapii TaxID=426704 RepID=A0A511AUV4_9LACT|nr:threonine/serine exporter family protein [Alkalibacterium kapii]GEK91980.1 membrane protein [Alkalibacterium kapii]